MGLNFKISCLYLSGDSLTTDTNWHKYIKCDLKSTEHSGIAPNA